MKWSRETVYRWLVPGCVTLGLLVVAGAAGWEWRASSRALPEGMAAFQAGDNLKAIRHLTRAQQNCETDILARYYLGASYQNYGWDSEAEQQYLTTCQLADEYGTRAWHSLGRIRYHKGDVPGAAAAFEHALALDPKAVVVWFELGQVQQVLGKLEDAERSLAEALRLDPENSDCQKALLKVTLARRAGAGTAKEATVEPAATPAGDKPPDTEENLEPLAP